MFMQVKNTIDNKNILSMNFKFPWLLLVTFFVLFAMKMGVGDTSIQELSWLWITIPLWIQIFTILSLLFLFIITIAVFIFIMFFVGLIAALIKG